MAITFPTRPEINQNFTFGTRTWKWNGVAWDAVFVFEPTGGSGLNSVGVSGGAIVENPETLTLETLTDVLNISASQPTNDNALLTFSIEDEPGTHISHTLQTNHFSSLSSSDRNNKIGRKFLVLNDDGTVGFQNIFIQDIFKDSEFGLLVSNFRLNGQTENRALIGPNNSLFTLSNLAGTNDQFTVQYTSPTVETISARIDSPSFETSGYELDPPYTSLSTINPDLIRVDYPNASDGVVTFTLTAEGDNGDTKTSTCSLIFPNYLYYGVVAQNEIGGDDLDQLGFTSVLTTESDLNSSIELTWTLDTNEVFWLAYPSKFGPITAVENLVGGFDATDEFPTRDPELHVNENGYEELYYIYRQSQPGGGYFRYRFTI